MSDTPKATTPDGARVPLQVLEAFELTKAINKEVWQRKWLEAMKIADELHSLCVSAMSDEVGLNRKEFGE